MAKDEQVIEDEAPPKSKKMLVIIIAVVVLVLAIGGAAAFLMMGSKGKHGGKDHAQSEEAADEEHSKPAPMVAFEEKFTVNLRAEDGTSHYMQVPKIELEMSGEAAAKKIEEHKSKVSDRINSALRNKSMKEMLEPGSDIKLKEELKKVINEAIEVKPQDAAKNGVKEVILPSSFIVQ